MVTIVRRFVLFSPLIFLLVLFAAPIRTQAYPASCGEPATFIHHIQGSSDTSPLDGQTVTIEGVVTADYQQPKQLRGYFVQEEDTDTDGDSSTSEGLFIFDPAHNVDEGRIVRVTGRVDEYFGLTELTGVSTVLDCGASEQPAYAAMPFPHTNEQLEQVEGMLVQLPENLVVTELYNLGRGGEITLAYGSRLYQPTHMVMPGPGANDVQVLNNNLRIVVDDGSLTENPDPVPYPAPSLSPDNRLRVGDVTAVSVNGVLAYSWSGWYGSDNAFRIHPSTALTFESHNPRPTSVNLPEGHLIAGSFNVLNYFNGDGQGGGFPTPRGAGTSDEFKRQRDKLINAIVTLNPDILGLMEIENDGYGTNSAIQDLVNGLNDFVGFDAYAFIDPGVEQIGDDEIAVGLIFKQDTVSSLGVAVILDSSADPTFIDSKNRPALAQTFVEKATGERLTVAVNHLKSKGSDCDALDDPNTNDGQGNCNLTRTSAANAEVNWLATDPTGSGDPDFLILGDLNAYRYEDPIRVIIEGGYTDLIARFGGDNDYSYGFKGQYGYLDHALANVTLAAQVTGATTWHINADEPSAFDYNDYNLPGLYTPNLYRASDHDPSVVSLRLGQTITHYLPLIMAITPRPTPVPTEPPAHTPTPSPTLTPSLTPTSISQPTNTSTPTQTSTPTTTVETPTATPTTTATVNASPGVLELGTINYDGDVPQVESDEYIEVINVGDSDINVLNWSVRDDDGNIFYFPNFIMQPSQACRVYTDEDHPEHCGFSFGSDRAIWGNSGDIVILKDSSGTTIDTYCWRNGCP